MGEEGSKCLPLCAGDGAACWHLSKISPNTGCCSSGSSDGIDSMGVVILVPLWISADGWCLTCCPTSYTTNFMSLFQTRQSGKLRTGECCKDQDISNRVRNRESLFLAGKRRYLIPEEDESQAGIATWLLETGIRISQNLTIYTETDKTSMIWVSASFTILWK